MNAATSPPTYCAHVDGLRAVAVLCVLLYHLNPAWLPGGYVGVDVFFVISGFVVTAPECSRHAPAE
jgi:peptidoglycan/LPS O-acetylase OafA/YrhL